VQTEAQLSATRTTLINARRDVANARNLLAYLLGEPELTIALRQHDLMPDTMPDIADCLALARAHRHDLAAAQAAVQAARREVEVAWGQYYPSIDLDLSAFLHRETSPEDRDWDAVLSANLPIFAAGRIHADVREAWSFFREAVLVQQQFERRLVQQVRRAYDDFVASGARLAELRVQVAAAEQAERLASEAARVGLGTNLDRIVAQDALLSAQLQLASEEFDRELLYLTLLRTVGMLRESLNAEMNVMDQQLTMR
jgi:outer membrane protein